MGDFCHGNGTEHCCYVNGEVCPFLEVDTTPGRKWSCGLLNKLGSWEAVHADLGYQWYVQQQWDVVGIESCGAWRIPGQCCFGDNNPPVYNVGSD